MYNFDDFKDDYSEEEDYKDGEGELSFMYTLCGAESGNCEQQYLMGFIYSTSGYGVKRDIQKAEYWYKKAADNGNSRAQCALADILSERGELSSAFDMYLKSARQGNYYAQTRAGVAYFKGEGVEKNITEAKLWLSQGVGGGYGEAAYYLAQFFKGVDKSQYTDALTEAVRLDYADAYRELANMLIEKGDYSSAMEIFKLAAKRGHGWAKRIVDGG